MASIQKFESIKGNIFYVTMFDGETVTLPHQNVQNNTLALIRGNGVVSLSAGEITIHGSGQFLFYNNKWNYIAPEVTRERLDDEIGTLNQAIETLSEELGTEITRIDSEIEEINSTMEELDPLIPQEYVLEVVPETGLDMATYQTYKVGKVVFIYAIIINNTEETITLTPQMNFLQLVGGRLVPNSGRLNVSTNLKPVLAANSTSFIHVLDTFTFTPNSKIVVYGFLFSN